MWKGVYYSGMKTARQKAKLKSAAPAKRASGRPRVDNPMVSQTLRFDPETIMELDAWAKDHGNMARSAAIRMAVSNMLRGRAAEKSS